MSDLRPRTKRFALNVIHLCKSLPNAPECRVIRKQLLRSATSVGANYRAACHARSHKDFIAKLALVEEEGDESQFWLELLDELGAGLASQVSELAGRGTPDCIDHRRVQENCPRGIGLLTIRNSTFVLRNCQNWSRNRTSFS
ncbi:four helix bundle protein [Salinibacter sp.]|uniref:four helix bundle protein n=1 Tax=Salinibacter sp. TaxID=2065818 RepID=UPI0021E8DF71|nr:four helix bundle protein [Salinibacter sp.]